MIAHQKVLMIFEFVAKTYKNYHRTMTTVKKNKKKFVKVSEKIRKLQQVDGGWGFKSRVQISW